MKTGLSEFDYLRTGNKFKNSDVFYRYVAGYPDKSGLQFSLYRLIPKIDLMLIGINRSVIHSSSNEGEFTEHWVGENFGRGKYHVMVNDAQREGTKLVAETWFDLQSHEKPPVYDPRTLMLGEVSNTDEINRLVNLGVMVRDRNLGGQPRLRVDSDGAANPAAQQTAAPNPLGSLDLGAIVTHMLTQGSRATHDSVKDTIEVAKLLQPPPIDLEATVERVLTRMGIGGGVKSLDPFEQYERVDKILDRFRPQTDSSGAVVRSMAEQWGPHLPGIVREARGLWGEIVAGIKDLRGARTETATPHNGANRMPQVLPYEQRMETIFRLAFEEMNKGTKGYDFAAYICGFFPGGLEVFVNLDPVGAAGVIGMLAMNPQARTLVNDPDIRPQLESFLDSFFSFDASPLLNPPAAGAAPAAAPGS